MARPPKSQASDWLVSVLLTITITAVAVALVEELWHWLVLPTAACGSLAGVDAIRWIRRRLDTFDPRALVGLFAYHLTFLAPILHVWWDYWPKHVAGAADWRASLGLLAVLNFGGLLIYRWIIELRLPPSRQARLDVDDSRFVKLAVFGGMASLLAWLFIIYTFNGPVGYLAVVTQEREALEGRGWLFLIGEAWPLLLFSAAVVRNRARLESSSAFVVVTLGIFVLAQFLAGGLRGSRSNTVWPVLLGVIVLHLVARQIKSRQVIAGALIVFGFMYGYGFYKALGTEAVDAGRRHGSTASLAAETGRNERLLLLEDFGRAGTQAILIDRQINGELPALAAGRSYVGDVVNLLLDDTLASRFPSKVAYGTDALYGPGAHASGARSSRIYGLTGEGIPNFGLWGAPLVFIPFAFFVRTATRAYGRAREGGVRLDGLLAPILTVAALLALGSDLDNVAWFFAKHALPLAAVVWLARTKVQRLGRGGVPGARIRHAPASAVRVSHELDQGRLGCSG